MPKDADQSLIEAIAKRRPAPNRTGREMGRVIEHLRHAAANGSRRRGLRRLRRAPSVEMPIESGISKGAILLASEGGSLVLDFHRQTGRRTS